MNECAQFIEFIKSTSFFTGTLTYNPPMDNDDTLREFVQILGRIADLAGEALMSDDEEIDLVTTIQNLRKSGNDTDADKLAELVQRADELKAQHQTKS